MKRPNALLLDPAQKRVLYWSTGILWATGAWWLYRPGPLWLKIHGAAAMAFLLVFGVMLAQHVPAGLAQERHKPSGITLLSACSTLVLTGWGLYYLGNEQFRHYTSQVHSYLGIALPILILIHLL